MRVRRLGKFAALTSIAALAISTVVTTPSFAANKAKAVCPKANAKATISGEKYICIKNPYTIETKKTAKLTWTMVACVDAHKVLLGAREDLVKITTSSKDTAVKIDAEIKVLEAALPAKLAAAAVWDAKAIKYRAQAESSTALAVADLAKANQAGINVATKTMWTRAATARTQAATSYKNGAINAERLSAGLKKTQADIDAKKKTRDKVLGYPTVIAPQVDLAKTNRDLICTL